MEPNTQQQSDIDQYEIAIENAEAQAPAEVVDFVWSPAFTETITMIGGFHKLIPEQIAVVEDVVRQGLLGIITDNDDAKEFFTKAGITDETQDTILQQAALFCAQPLKDRMDLENLVDTTLLQEELPTAAEKTKPSDEGIVVPPEVPSTPTITNTQPTYRAEPIIATPPVAPVTPTSTITPPVSQPSTQPFITPKPLAPTKKDYSIQTPPTKNDPYRETV